MKNVMKNAWEIARNAVKKFGGNVKEYFAESLKLAWAAFKKPTLNIFKELRKLSAVMNAGNFSFKTNVWQQNEVTDRMYFNLADGNDGQDYFIIVSTAGVTGLNQPLPNAKENTVVENIVNKMNEMIIAGQMTA